jgi:hypothetical protein
VDEISLRATAKWRVMRLTALAAVGLAAAIVVILVLVLPRSSGGQGPLEVKTGGRNARIGVGQPGDVGHAVSVSGPLIVQNTGDHAVVLDRVELVGLQSGIYRGAYVLPWPPKRIPFTGARTYRVPRDGRTMPGVTVAPHAFAWIVIGLTARRGQHQWTSVDVVYHDRGNTYRSDGALAGAVCAPFKKYLKASCDPPGFSDG